MRLSPRAAAWIVAASVFPGAGALASEAQPVPAAPAAGVSAAPAAGGSTRATEAPAISAARIQVDDGEKLMTDLRFEDAIGALGQAIASLEGAPGADARALRTRAFDLRAQAWLSLGKPDLADADFESLVRADPAYMLDERTLSPKIVGRFRKIHSALTGTLRLSCRPADLRVRLDGEEQRSCTPDPLPVLAGDHTLAAERAGFDSADLSVTVAAGAETATHVALVPNARTLLVRTIPSGVEVLMDGRPVGVTLPGPGDESAPLIIEPVAPGEHQFRLRKDCRVEQLRTFTVVVDMLDLTPVELKTVTLPPARTLLSVRSDPPGAEIFVAGEPLGTSPVESRDVCAGTHPVEARFPGGARWIKSVELPPGGSLELPVAPRPDLLLALDEEAEASLQPLRERLARFERFNVIVAPREPGLSLDARLVPGRLGTRLRFTLASPAHAQAEIREFDFDPVAPGAPDWRAFLDSLDSPLVLRGPAIGALLVDVGTSRGPVVLEVRSGSAAAAAGLRAGDEIVSVQGTAPASAAEARRKILDPAAGGPVSLKVRTGAAERDARLSPVPAPLLPGLDGAGPGAPSLHAIAAQARAVAASGPEADRPLALLASGFVLLQFGEPEKALRDSLRRVELAEGPGVSRGTVNFLAGIAYEAAGSRAEAAAAFGAAASSREATVHGLDDASIATAARVRAERAALKP